MTRYLGLSTRAMYAEALDRHVVIEQRLARITNAWRKSRAALRRLEKRLNCEEKK